MDGVMVQHLGEHPHHRGHPKTLAVLFPLALPRRVRRGGRLRHDQLAQLEVDRGRRLADVWRALRKRGERGRGRGGNGNGKDTVARVVGVGQARQHGGQHARRERQQRRARQLHELLQPRDRRQLRQRPCALRRRPRPTLPTLATLPPHSPAPSLRATARA